MCFFPFRRHLFLCVMNLSACRLIGFPPHVIKFARALGIYLGSGAFAGRIGGAAPELVAGVEVAGTNGKPPAERSEGKKSKCSADPPRNF